eukprot:10241742-Alexandrium_andersonii.AAC.1
MLGSWFSVLGSASNRCMSGQRASGVVSADWVFFWSVGDVLSSCWVLAWGCHMSEWVKVARLPSASVSAED